MVSVQDYLDRHKLSIRIEEAVNAAVRAQSEDPVAYIASHLRKHSVSVITKVDARQVLDSRGIPTIEAEITTNRGSYSAVAPTGLSSSIYTAADLRDGDSSSFFGKVGVSKAVDNVVTVLAPMLVGKDPREQADLDKLMTTELDHSSDMPKQLGANAVRAVSLAVCKAGAAEKDLAVFEHIADLGGNPIVSIPAPLISLIHGGPHVANGLPFREVLCLPSKADTLSQALKTGAEVSHALLATVREKYGDGGVRFTEGGEFVPPVQSIREAFDLVLLAAQRSGLKDAVELGLDASAGDLFNSAEGVYELGRGSGTEASSEVGNIPTEQTNGTGPHMVPGKTNREELVELYRGLTEEYKLAVIIDPFELEDFQTTGALTRSLEGTQTKVLGGELLAGNIKRIAQAAASKACTGQDLKLPSVGTLSDVIGAVRAARDADWTTSLSCCPGESEDPILADVAVGTGVQWIRAGSVFGSQHTAKYNRMLFIEEEQEGKIPYLKPDEELQGQPQVA